MDQSPNTTPQKTSPLIIKLCCTKESDVSPNDSLNPNPQPSTSPKTKPVTVKMKPVALTFCRLSKDGVISKAPEPLKISPALSLKLGAALREKISLKCLPSKKVTVLKLDQPNEAERQSLTSHSSKLADNRLDFVHGGDKSQVLQLSQPPLTMQPSNLHTDDLLDVKYGGGGSEPSVVQGSSSALSPVASSSVTSTKSVKKYLAEKETEMEPARKKIKLYDAIKVGPESHCESVIGAATEKISTKKTKIIELRNPPSGKQTFLEPSVYVLEKEEVGLEAAQSQLMLPPTSHPPVEKAKDVSVKLELPSVIDNKQSATLRTEHPNFIVAHSSNNSDSKKESDMENLKTHSPLKSKYSDAYPELIKCDPISTEVSKLDANVDKTKLKKPVSLFGLNQKSEIDVSQSNAIPTSMEYSSSTSANVALGNEIAFDVNVMKTEVSETLVDQKEILKKDPNWKLNPESVCPLNQSGKKSSHFNLEKSHDISIGFDQVDEINIDKNKSPEIEDKNITIDAKDQDKKSGSSCKQGLKVCPFKFQSSFKGRFDTESDKSLKSVKVFKKANKFLELQCAKDDVSCAVNDETVMESVVDYKDSLTFNNNCEIESSINKAQSESVVNHNEIQDEDPNSKASEFGTQDDFSGGEDNELLGISSDESNHMDSQNGAQEPEIEFDILDEFESNDNDPDPEIRSSDSESEISAEEIDAMLEAGLGDYGKPSIENQHEVKEKVILKVRGKDHFEVLPEGWIEVTHNSGIPIYLHKLTRVCCVSKPYFLGPGSTRKHEIPISAIPCLHYIKELEKEKLEAENKLNGIDEDLKDRSTSMNNKDSCQVNGNGIDNAKAKNHATENGCANTGVVGGSETKSEVTEKNSAMQNTSNSPKGSNLIFPSAKLESVKEVKVSGSLDHLAVREYCQKRFEFQTITVKRFKTWFGRRKHQKQMRRKQRPFLPDSTQLITCPLPSNTDKTSTIGSASKREFIMNPIGKSPVCILHEYVQHTLRVQPKYIFKELESASTPYGAVVIINDMEYGTGYGSSKKVAKSEAAKSALEVLIPKIKKFDPEKRSGDEDDYQDVEFFDQVRVEDPRISDLSVKAGQPFPYQILLECLKRNYGMGDTEISIRMKNLKHQKNEFIMKVGKHKATVVCKNKRDGKHRASQAILQQLHPHINSWGSLLRMYGKGSCKTLKEKKEEEQRITELQSKACVNKPNISILNKLKEEMMKYREKMKSKKPIGKLIPERMQLFSISDSNLKSIEL